MTVQEPRATNRKSVRLSFKSCSRALLVLALAIGSGFPVSAAQTHRGAKVLGLHIDATRPCAFFRLERVGVADPVTATPWFSLPKSHPAFPELYAMLLTASVTGKSVDVQTTGTFDCGFAAVDFVGL